MSVNPSQQEAHVQVSHESHHFVNTHFPAINHFFSTSNSSYEIFKESKIVSNEHQVYHVLHLLGKEDRKLYTITYLTKTGHSVLYQYGVGYLPHQLGYGTLAQNLHQANIHLQKQEKHDHHCIHHH